MKLQPRFLIGLIVFSFAICKSNLSKAQDTLTFDCKANNFVPAVSKYIYLREGRMVIVKYNNINPFSVTSNSTVTGMNRNDTDAMGFLTAITVASQAAQKKTSSDNLDNFISSHTLSPITKKKELNAIAVERIKNIIDTLLIEKNKLINSVILQTNQISLHQSNINTLMILDTIITDAMKDPSLHSSTDFTNRIVSVSTLGINNVSEISANFNSNITAIDSLLLSLQTSLLQLKEINTQIKKTHTKDSSYAFDGYIETLNVNINKLQAAYTGDNRMSIQKKITGIIMNYQKAATAEYAVYSDKIFQIKDEIETFQDTVKLSNSKVYKIIGPIDIHSYGGTRIDFSLGFATTFGQINGTDYYLIKDSKDSVTGIGNSRKNRKLDLSPIAFMNFVFKLKGPLSLAASLGLNPDFSSLTNSKLLLGFSLVCMQTNSVLKRFLLTGGIGVGLTDVLKARFENIPNSQLKSLTDGDLTTKSLKAGCFIALSFNIGQNK